MILETLGHISNWIILIPFYLNTPWENWAPKHSSWVCLDKEHSCFPTAKGTVRKGKKRLLYFQEEQSTARVGFLMAVSWQGNSMGQAYSSINCMPIWEKCCLSNFPVQTHGSGLFHIHSGIQIILKHILRLWPLNILNTARDKSIVWLSKTLKNQSPPRLLLYWLWSMPFRFTKLLPTLLSAPILRMNTLLDPSDMLLCCLYILCGDQIQFGLRMINLPKM